MAGVTHLIPDRTEEKSILKAMKENSTKITIECNNEMDMYYFPAKKISVSEYQKVTRKNLKKIIMVGETGSGKSTLINAFVNYAAGIEIEDPLRFKLVNHEIELQTREISGYLIEDTLFEYPIMIWDTPGFKFANGRKIDEKIEQQIQKLLSVEDEFHAICFVIKADVNRLTDVQNLIIDNVKRLFGREAEKNMYTLTTFGYGDRPEVLRTLMRSNFPFDENRWFTFNNRHLFKTESQRWFGSKIYWDITINSIIQFHNTLAHQLPFGITRETRKANVFGYMKVESDEDYYADYVEELSSPENK
ncbi:hypothetical protein LOD99_1923 [Oopsacas minuta]|uniref:AIG1-type G domain-containing protein n=1 Tax=Oopsacas minuta TaxID=111878 RepID=A0AAV7K5X7_9METZ|nr:hypothetical protein LOD99_1923 [Oopsacas minuta]